MESYSSLPFLHKWPLSSISSSPTSIAATLLIVACFTIVFLYRITTTNSRSKHNDLKAPPKYPGAWPLMGHLRLFGGSNPAHVTLANMAEKYGSTPFMIRFGQWPTLVVSSSDTVKECFNNTNDKLFSNRTITRGIRDMFYDMNAFGFASYGSYWRELRKVLVLTLLSPSRVDSVIQLKAPQFNGWFKKLYEECTNKKSGIVEMKSWLEVMMFNVLASMVVLPKDEGSIEKFRPVLAESVEVMGKMCIDDLIPRLGWLDHFTGLVKQCKVTGKKLDTILNSWLEDHRDEKVADEEKGMIGKLLSMKEGSKLLGHEGDTAVKANILGLLLGAGDSAGSTLTWAIVLLLNHPRMMERLREELDSVVGKHRQVEDADVKNFTYLQAILKETMRLYPVATILLRETPEDCVVAGCHIAAGTRLMVNVWQVQRDPNVWSDPLEFKPDRFQMESAHVDFSGQYSELIPFGTGRRMCPAITLSVRVMLLTLARLIHSFDMKIPNGESSVDTSIMTVGVGFGNLKLTPLEIELLPRLDSKIYG
uniref:CYP82BE1 n=1 Tax=Corydalis yanhusuo TaxID=458692 RepID=A0AA96NFJ2_9MAGN|nr:CYP82BE1 [Corydalis yanhusuo]